MKKILLLAGLALSFGMSTTTEAQVRVSFNIGVPVAQQSWSSYDDDYYYMPEQNVYYNTRRGAYVYQQNGAWLTAGRLPSSYGNCNYRNTHYVRMNSCEPFAHNQYYRRSGYRDNIARRDYRDNCHDEYRDNSQNNYRDDRYSNNNGNNYSNNNGNNYRNGYSDNYSNNNGNNYSNGYSDNGGRRR